MEAPVTPCPVPSAPFPLPRAPGPLPRALCPVPRALCPVPRALCPLPRAPCRGSTNSTHSSRRGTRARTHALVRQVLRAGERDDVLFCHARRLPAKA
jgi:hypothetical protein